MCTYVYIVNVVDGDKLSIRKISRLHMGSYLCVASNGVPPTRSKRINVTVHCKYKKYVKLSYNYFTSCPNVSDPLKC